MVQWLALCTTFTAKGHRFHPWSRIWEPLCCMEKPETRVNKKNQDVLINGQWVLKNTYWTGIIWFYFAVIMQTCFFLMATIILWQSIEMLRISDVICIYALFYLFFLSVSPYFFFIFLKYICFINLGNSIFYLKNSFEIYFFYKYIIYIFGVNDTYFRLLKILLYPR